MRSVRISAPAKINLGLSIIGKRSDGYHEIDTIMAMIDVVDTITLREVEAPGVSISGMDDVPVASNLITKALYVWGERTGHAVAHHVDVVKRIPSPAGLGGGSSDAAAILRALDTLYEARLSGDDMHHLAALLGADCPFFLGTTCARATGIGTTLAPLQPPRCWAVIIVPPVRFPAKTAALYGALRPEDYGSAEQMGAVELAIDNLRTLHLVNGFTRAALELFPPLHIAAEALTAVAGGWSLSGAGPAIFAITPSEAEASRWQTTLYTLLPATYTVLTSRFLAEPPHPEVLL